MVNDIFQDKWNKNPKELGVSPACLLCGTRSLRRKRYSYHGNSAAFICSACASNMKKNYINIPTLLSCISFSAEKSNLPKIRAVVI